MKDCLVKRRCSFFPPGGTAGPRKSAPSRGTRAFEARRERVAPSCGRARPFGRCGTFACSLWQQAGIAFHRISRAAASRSPAIQHGSIQ